MSVIIGLYYVYGFPLGVAVTLLVGWYFLQHPEKFEKWASIVAWFVSHFWKKAEYFAIKTEIQGKINSFIDALETNTAGSFPRITLRWTAQGEDEVIWEEGHAIIVMRDRNQKNKNFVNATYLFTSQALLNKASRHLSKSQKTSLDLFSTKLILEQENKAALEQFMSDFFVKETDKNDGIRELVGRYVHIERIGAFFPILIQELNYLGSKVFLKKPTQEVNKEVKELICFLEAFAQREVGDTTTPDTFMGKYTRCAIRIVASRPVRETGDVRSHRDRIFEVINKKIENIYVIGNGVAENRTFMDSVVSAVLASRPTTQLVKSYTFKGKIKIQGSLTQVSTYLIHLHNPDAVSHLYQEND